MSKPAEESAAATGVVAMSTPLMGTPPRPKPMAEAIAAHHFIFSPRHKERQRPWNRLLEGSLCVGENHSQVQPKKFLIQNMRLFKESGFAVIFLEHFSALEHQSDIDAFCSAPEAEMPKDLSDYVEGLNEGHMIPDLCKADYRAEIELYNFRTLLEAAKAAGIRVVCLEKDMRTYKAIDLKDGDKRRQVFSMVAQERINSWLEEYAKAGGGAAERPKFIVFAGVTHMNTFSKVPGICDLIPDLQDLFIREPREGGKSALEISDLKVRHYVDEDGAEEGILASMMWTSVPGEEMVYDPELPGRISAKRDSPAYSVHKMSILPADPASMTFPNPFAARRLHTTAASHGPATAAVEAAAAAAISMASSPLGVGAEFLGAAGTAAIPTHGGAGFTLIRHHDASEAGAKRDQPFSGGRLEDADGPKRSVSSLTAGALRGGVGVDAIPAAGANDEIHRESDDEEEVVEEGEAVIPAFSIKKSSVSSAADSSKKGKGRKK
jgi:hypothetical protein